MKHIITILIGFFVYNLTTANVQYNPEVTFYNTKPSKANLAVQNKLRKQVAWQNFTRKYGQWYVEFNEKSGTPHRAFGKPVAINEGATIKDKADLFLQPLLQDLGLSMNNLQLTNITTSKYHYVNYQQTYNGLEILGARTTLRMTKGNEVVMFGIDAFKDINIAIEPTVSFNEAVLNGIQDLEYDAISIEDVYTLKVLPIPGEKQYNYHLVYEFFVSTKKEGNIPGEFYILTDAHTGKVLYRTNRIHTADNVAVTVIGTAYEKNPLTPPVQMAVPNLEIILQNPKRVFYTDENGFVNFNDSTTFDVSVDLDGRWSTVIHEPTNEVVGVDTSFMPGTDTFSFTNLVSTNHVSAYNFVNDIHDHMKGNLPEFSGMDFNLRTNVERTDGSCNAFYSGYENNINFYRATAQCNTFAAVGDVVYHEYGHAINANFYQSQGATYMYNGALNEGYADIWALSLTKDPVLGKGTFSLSPGQYIRRYDVESKVFPEDLVGEVHADGEIIAGAWWDVGQHLDSIDLMMEIFSEAFYGVADGFNGNEGEIYKDVLLDALLADDDDGNIFNGTPHALAIVEGFAEHGIILLAGVIAHEEVQSAQPDSIISLSTEVLLPFFYLEDPVLFYKSQTDDIWKRIALDPLDATNYFTEIDPQPAGTILEYYFQIEDNFDLDSATLPIDMDRFDKFESNIPYQILIGHTLEVEKNFDSGDENEWSLHDSDDDARGGEWEIGTSIGSYEEGHVFDPAYLIQPDNGHTDDTENPCAFTENANSVYTFPASRDVDFGKTTLFSPIFNLSAYSNPVFSYYRWFYSEYNIDDSWKTYITSNGTDWMLVEETTISDASWRRFAFLPGTYIDPQSTYVQLKFVIEDEGQPTVVEGALDDLQLFNYQAPEVIEPSVGSVALYPNPTQGDFTLAMPSILPEETVNIKISDITGRIIFADNQVAHTNGVINFSLNGLNTGNYFVEIVTSELSEVKKIIYSK